MGEFIGDVVTPVRTMSEYYGSHVAVLGIICLMIPSWMSKDQLKNATKTIIGVQVILTLVPIYHAGITIYILIANLLYLQL